LQTLEYLREENRVLREQLGDRRVRFNDDQRRRLAAKAKGLGRKHLAEVATLVTPETLVRSQKVVELRDQSCDTEQMLSLVLCIVLQGDLCTTCCWPF
jgi:hypothetical protein